MLPEPDAKWEPTWDVMRVCARVCVSVSEFILQLSHSAQTTLMIKQRHGP